MPSSSATPLTESGEGRLSVINKVNCQLFSPTGRNASSNHRPMARLARWTRAQRHFLPIVSAVA
jgi:hypothetical protein